MNFEVSSMQEMLTSSSEFVQFKAAKMAHLMEDEVFMAFTTYATIVILKMMLMSPLTSYYRITRGVSNNIGDFLDVFSFAQS